jgi:hypothetical protein
VEHPVFVGFTGMEKLMPHQLFDISFLLNDI